MAAGTVVGKEPQRREYTWGYSAEAQITEKIRKQSLRHTAAGAAQVREKSL